MSNIGTVGKTFNVTLTGGATFDKLPIPDGKIVRKIIFKSRGNLPLEYKYRETDTDTVQLQPGDIYDIWDVAVRYHGIFINGTIGDIVDGEYWL